MPRKPFDPVQFVPSPDILREKLMETETLASRLRILLDASEKLHGGQPGQTSVCVKPAGDGTAPRMPSHA